MTFNDFLESYGTSSEWESVKTIFAQFPAYTLGGDSPVYTIYTLFVERYKYREIGAETPSLFAHFVEDRARELVVKYAWKLQLFNEQYTQVMGRFVKVEESGNDYVYLYPINSTAKRLASSTSFDRNSAAAIGGGISNPELLTLSLNLRDIFIDVIQEFEPLFMGVM